MADAEQLSAPDFATLLKELEEAIQKHHPSDARRALEGPSPRPRVPISGAEGPNGESFYAPEGTPSGRQYPRDFIDHPGRHALGLLESTLAFGGMPGALGPAGAVANVIRNPGAALNELGRAAGDATAAVRDLPNKLGSATDYLTSGFRSANVTPAEEAARAATLRPPSVQPSATITPGAIRPDRPQNFASQPGLRGASDPPELVGPWGVKRPDTSPAWTAETQANRAAVQASEETPYVQLRKGDIGADGNPGQFVSKTEQDAHLRIQVAQPRRQRLEAEREKLFMDEVRKRALETEGISSSRSAPSPTPRRAAPMSARPAAQSPAPPEMSPIIPRNGLAQSAMENPVATGVGIGGAAIGGGLTYLELVKAGLLPRPQWMGGPDAEQGDPNVQGR